VLYLTRGRVCRLQLLLVLASAVILGFESRGTRDHILLPQIRDFLFRRLLRLAGLQWRYSTPPPHGIDLISSLLYSLFCRTKLASRRPDMKRYTSSFLWLSLKCVFRCCENNLYLAVVTETFLYVLPRNLCPWQPWRRVSTSRYLAMDLHVNTFNNDTCLGNILIQTIKSPALYLL
jgi:hypothetical protein